MKRKFEPKNISESMLIDSMLKKLINEQESCVKLTKVIYDSYRLYLLPELKHKFKLIEKVINSKYKANVKLHINDFDNGNIVYNCKKNLKSKYIHIFGGEYNYLFSRLSCRHKNSKIDLFSKFPKDWVNLSDDAFTAIIAVQLLFPKLNK